MTSKSYSGSITPAVTYCYDALPSSPGVCSGGQAAGYQGRLTKVFTAAAGPIPATSFDIPSYDGAGRPASSQETVGALAAYRFNSYQYNLQDALTSLT